MMRLSFCAPVLLAGLLAHPAAAAPAQDPVEFGRLSNDQKQLAEQVRRLEKILTEIEAREREAGAETRADLLQKAREKLIDGAKDRPLASLLEEVAMDLADLRAGDALEQQAELILFLEELLDFLLETERREQVQDLMEAARNREAELRALAERQAELRRRTEALREQEARTGEVDEEERQAIADAQAQLNEEIRAAAESNESEAGADNAERAAEEGERAEDSLRNGSENQGGENRDGTEGENGEDREGTEGENAENRDGSENENGENRDGSESENGEGREGEQGENGESAENAENRDANGEQNSQSESNSNGEQSESQTGEPQEGENSAQEGQENQEGERSPQEGESQQENGEQQAQDPSQQQQNGERQPQEGQRPPQQGQRSPQQQGQQQNSPSSPQQQLQDAEEAQRRAEEELREGADEAAEEAERLEDVDELETLINVLEKSEELLARHERVLSEFGAAVEQLDGATRVPRSLRVDLRKWSTEQKAIADEADSLLFEIREAGADAFPFLLRGLVDDHGMFASRMGPPKYRATASTVQMGALIKRDWERLIEAIRIEAERVREQVEQPESEQQDGEQGEPGEQPETETPLVGLAVEIQLLKQLQEDLVERMSSLKSRRDLLAEAGISLDEDEVMELEALVERQKRLRNLFESILERLQEDPTVGEEI